MARIARAKAPNRASASAGTQSKPLPFRAARPMSERFLGPPSGLSQLEGVLGVILSGGPDLACCLTNTRSQARALWFEADSQGQGWSG